MTYEFEVTGNDPTEIEDKAAARAWAFFGSIPHAVEIGSVKLNQYPTGIYTAAVSATEIEVQ